MRRILTLALAGVFTLAGCSDDDEKSSPPAPTNAAPVLSFDSVGGTTESLVALAASATDADAGDTLACTFTLHSQPRGSRVTLSAESGDCRGPNALYATFTPLVEGSYVVRITASDGSNTSTLDATFNIASRYGGGTVSGTVAAPSASTTALLTTLSTFPSNGGAVTAQNAFKAFANIALTGTPPVQGSPLAWDARPYDVVDVREPADFAAGHIPGAINVPLDELPRVLLGDPRFPGTATAMRRVLVTGYSQGDSSLAANILTAGRFSLGAIPNGTTPAGVADQRIFFLAQGMATWTFDKAVAPMRWDDDLGLRRFQWKPGDGTGYVVASATPTTPYDKAAQPRYEYPNVTDFNAATSAPMKQILVRIREWAAWARSEAEANDVPGSQAFVTNWGRWKQLVDSGTPPQVLTTQVAVLQADPAPPAPPTPDYQWQVAHAVGSIPITAADTLNATELTLYRPSEPIFVHCFTNTGAVAPCFRLSVLGYQSRTILYGVTGALDPSLTTAGYNTGFVDGVVDKGSGGNDFPLASEANPETPQSLAWATPPRSGCVECHRDYAAHFTEVTLTTTTAPPTEVLSEGEG
jgi:rhodanese-related sulfurtransferase